MSLTSFLAIVCQSYNLELKPNNNISAFLTPNFLVLQNSENKPVNFVESNDERGFPIFEKVQRLDGLRFETMHNIYHKDGDVAQGRTSGSQIAERLMSRSVDDQETGYSDFHL